MRLPLALAAASAATLAACTSSTHGTPTAPSTATSTSSSAASSSSAPPTSAATARAALMTVTDIGPGFSPQGFPGGADSNTTSPCLPAGSPSLDTKYPPAARARTGFRSNSPQALLGEQVALYHDDGTARSVISYAQKALRCNSATVQGQKVRIQASTPVRQVGGESVDSAQSWALAIGPAAASIVAVRIGNAVVSMEFIALRSTDLSKLPPEGQLVAAAIRKAKSALS